MEKSCFHVVQRGYRKDPVFFEEDDYQAYFDFLIQACQDIDVQVLAYAFLPAHVRLILTTDAPEDIVKAVGRANRLYKRRIYFRTGLERRLWQEQMVLLPLQDEQTLTAAIGFVEMEPVALRCTEKAWEYPWSSARPRRDGMDNRLVEAASLDDLAVGDWNEFLVKGEFSRVGKRLNRRERRARLRNRLNPFRFITKISAERTSEALFTRTGRTRGGA